MRASVPWTTRSGAASLAVCWRGFALIFIEFGQRFAAEEIIANATGKGLDTGAFFRHLEAKRLS